MIRNGATVVGVGVPNFTDNIVGTIFLPQWRRIARLTIPYRSGNLIVMLNVHGIITIIALVGSYFVLRAFHKFRNLRTASNNILVSLSIADGLLAIPLILDIIQLCLKYNAAVRPHMRMHILKEVDGTITLFLLSVIVLHLTLMSSERFIAIKFALRYQALVTKRRSRIVSIAMWLWALVVTIALPSLGCLRQRGKISESVAERWTQTLIPPKCSTPDGILYSKLRQCFLSPFWSFYSRTPTSS